MKKPEFITFTGIDDKTSVDGMARLSKQYPIEWGMLFSRERQGVDNRYPATEKGIQSIIPWCNDGKGIRLAAHLCGAYARDIMAGDFLHDSAPVELSFFKRVQVNHADPDPFLIGKFAREWETRAIAQSRSPYVFPLDGYGKWSGVEWLYDPSG